MEYKLGDWRVGSKRTAVIQVRFLRKFCGYLNLKRMKLQNGLRRDDRRCETNDPQPVCHFMVSGVSRILL
jgi:hypothetical protein